MRRTDMMKYIVSDYLLPKLVPSHIVPNEKATPSENEHESVAMKQKKKRIRLIYAE